jgi:hypothetical protein
MLSEDLFMKEIRVLGVHVQNRIAEASEVQNVLTKFGANIKTRLGIHDIHGGDHADGLLLLELCGEIKEWDELENSLSSLSGVKVAKMSF